MHINVMIIDATTKYIRLLKFEKTNTKKEKETINPKKSSKNKYCSLYEVYGRSQTIGGNRMQLK